MVRKLRIFLGAAILGVMALGTVAAKGNVTVTVSPNPVAPGAAYTISACGLNTAMAAVNVYSNEGSHSYAVPVASGCATTSVLATQDSTSVTAPLSSGENIEVFVTWVSGGPQSSHSVGTYQNVQ